MDGSRRREKWSSSRDSTVILRKFFAGDDLSRFTVDAEVTITFASTLSFPTRDN